MSERVTAQGVDLRAILPVRKIRVQGTIELAHTAQADIQGRLLAILKEDPSRGWPSAEEQAVLEWANEYLGNVQLVIEEAEPL